MQTQLVDLVKKRIPKGFGISAATLTQSVFELLAGALKPDESAALVEGLGAQLPRELRSMLEHPHGTGELVRDAFLESLAERLDIDDDDAEVAAAAVLISLRELLESRDAADQFLERLPTDLAQMMDGAASF